MSDPYAYSISTEDNGSASGLFEYGTQDVIVKATRNVDGQKAAGWIRVSDEVMRDTNSFSIYMEHQIGLAESGLNRAIDKMLNPWKYANKDPFFRFGTFEPFPRLLRWEQRWDTVKHWRSHLAGWVGDLAYKIDPEHDQWGRDW